MIQCNNAQVLSPSPPPLGGGCAELAFDLIAPVVRRLETARAETARASDGGLLVGLLSSTAGEGVSTVAGSLAAAAAQIWEGEILLVDANWRRSNFRERFRGGDAAELHDGATGDDDWRRCTRPGPVENVSVLPLRATGAGCGDGLNPSRLMQRFDRLRKYYSLILFDLPPVGEGSAAVELAGRLDGVVLVVEAERARTEVLESTVRRLRENGANLLGAVLNKRRHHVPSWLYQHI